MATCFRPAQSALDVHVPSDDVALAGAQPHAERIAETRRVTGMVMEIGGSAAWLAWQIDADEVLIHEAKSQIDGIGESLERFYGRMPEDLRACMAAGLQNARSAADRNDLPGVARSAREIRAMADRYRAATVTR